MSCFRMIDERFKGLVRFKSHLAPRRGPISRPRAGGRAATMQMSRSRGSLGAAAIFNRTGDADGHGGNASGRAITGLTPAVSDHVLV